MTNKAKQNKATRKGHLSKNEQGFGAGRLPDCKSALWWFCATTRISKPVPVLERPRPKSTGDTGLSTGPMRACVCKSIFYCTCEAI